VLELGIRVTIRQPNGLGPPDDGFSLDALRFMAIWPGASALLIVRNRDLYLTTTLPHREA
jgi:hypothetical protein